MITPDHYSFPASNKLHYKLPYSSSANFFLHRPTISRSINSAVNSRKTASICTRSVVRTIYRAMNYLFSKSFHPIHSAPCCAIIQLTRSLVSLVLRLPYSWRRRRRSRIYVGHKIGSQDCFILEIPFHHLCFRTLKSMCVCVFAYKVDDV